MTPSLTLQKLGERAAGLKKKIHHANHLQQGYIRKGLSSRTAQQIAWATVNRMYGAGNRFTNYRRRPGSGARFNSARAASMRKAIRLRSLELRAI